MREVAQGIGMELFKVVLLLVAFGVFAAVILSTLVVVLIVAVAGWLAAFGASFFRRGGDAEEHAPKVSRLAGQEGT